MTRNSKANFHRICLGNGGWGDRQCYTGNFVGIDYIREIDLSPYLSLSLKGFQAELEPQYRKEDKQVQLNHEGKFRRRSSRSVKTALATTYTFCTEVVKGDIIACSDRYKNYIVGRITRGHHFVKSSDFPQSLGVKWLTEVLGAEDLDENLRKALKGRGTRSTLQPHQAAILELIDRYPEKHPGRKAVFGCEPFGNKEALEKKFMRHLPKLKWPKGRVVSKSGGWKIEKHYSINNVVADICAINNSKQEILVVELRHKIANSLDYGQALGIVAALKADPRYRKFDVRGCIVAQRPDRNLKCLLETNGEIDFHYYIQEGFKLIKH